MAVSFSIEKKIGTISEKSSGWAKELNIVKWSNNRPKFDIREWDSSHTSMGKGVTFTRDELEQLYRLLRDMFETDQPLKRLLYAVPKAWTDLGHFKKLLLEYYPLDKRKRNLLLVSAEEGIPERLTAMEVCSCNAMDELTQCLMDACGCKEQYAEEIMSTWAEALGIPVEDQDKELSSGGPDLNMGIVEPDIDPDLLLDLFGFDESTEEVPLVDGGTMDTLEINESTLIPEDKNTDDRLNLPENILDMNIDELDLSVRAFNNLRRNGIVLVRDLVCPDGNDMGRVRNFGRKSLEEFLSKLKELGYKSENDPELYDEHNHPGRDKCDTLRGIRKKIAEANGIPFDFPECHHTGPCKGTCPACEAEVRYLDEQLQKKKERGEEINLIGLAVGDIKMSGCNVNPDTDSSSERIEKEEGPDCVGAVWPDDPFYIPDASDEDLPFI